MGRGRNTSAPERPRHVREGLPIRSFRMGGRALLAGARFSKRYQLPPSAQPSRRMPAGPGRVAKKKTTKSHDLRGHSSVFYDASGCGGYLPPALSLYPIPNQRGVQRDVSAHHAYGIVVLLTSGTGSGKANPCGHVVARGFFCGVSDGNRARGDALWPAKYMEPLARIELATQGLGILCSVH